MFTIISAAVLVILFVRLIALSMTTAAAVTGGRAVRKASLTVFILGAFALVTSCAATHNAASNGTHSVKRYSAKKPVGYVKRATFTTKIRNREPTNNIHELHNNQQRIYYFTDLRGMQGQKVRHHWIYQGKVRAEVEFNVKGPRWRVYSSKRLEPDWLGDWTVVTVDRQGRTLSSDRFSYTKAPGFFRKAGKLSEELELFGDD